jgi:ssRNA-specific RNase YbeY (16S rRNA maturation enzyme)
MRIDIYATLGCTRVKKARVRQLIKKVLAAEDKTFKAVNVIIADDKYLSRLNERYFRKKSTTNVISFNLGEESEIYVSEDRASDAYELYYYILHGLLHTIGYDHTTKEADKIMEEKCIAYLKDE